MEQKLLEYVQKYLKKDVFLSPFKLNFSNHQLNCTFRVLYGIYCMYSIYL